MKRLVKGPVALVVLDGWGLRDETEHNGIALALTPNYDHYTSSFPFTELKASGEAVGLPSGQIGNSEVGHTTIGSGSVLYQDLVRITKDVESGDFAKNPVFAEVFSHVKKNGSQLHVIGLLSPGGVHSHEDHLLATIAAGAANGVKKIIVHPFLDGRDTPRTSGIESLWKLEAYISNIPGCHIGSVSGRYYAMDRDTNWDRTEKAFAAIFKGQADHLYDESVSPSQVIEERYRSEIFDEHLEPIVFTHNGKPLEVHDHDGIIFTNFRKDRAKQLSLKICEQTKDRDLLFVTMTKYGAEMEALVAYKPQMIEATIGMLVSEAGLHQAHIAETEKFPHVTYYVNGGRQEPYPNEDDVLLPSRKDIKTHDEAPEMRAKEICDEAIKRVGSNDFLFINFANPDMVGHTANEPAIIRAIEVVDRELGRLVREVLKLDGAILVIADHGNAETTVDPKTQEPHTAHTTNPVPCILIHNTFQPHLHQGKGLKDIAPTICTLLGITPHPSMTGESLLRLV